MAIQVGDKVPAVSFKTLSSSGLEDQTTDDIFKGKKVVLFAVPGAFTPTCSNNHLPGFVEKADEILAKGVDTIACISVNDPFVMAAWGADRKASNIMMVADGNGDFTRAVGLEMDGSGFGLGARSQRFALIAENGVVNHLAVEEGGKLEVSSDEAILNVL